MSEYGADGALVRFTTYQHEEKDWLHSQNWFTPDGRRHYQIRFSSPQTTDLEAPHPCGMARTGRSQSHLYFDESGERLVGVRGAMPKDLPWTWGWGQECDGLRCGLAPQKGSGAFEDICLALTVLNTTTEKRMLSVGFGAYRPILTDSECAVVPISETSRGAVQLELPGPSGGVLTDPGEAAYMHSFELTWWYDALPPGKYSIKIEYRGGSNEWLATSNSIPIQIEPREKQAAEQS